MKSRIVKSLEIALGIFLTLVILFIAVKQPRDAYGEGYIFCWEQKHGIDTSIKARYGHDICGHFEEVKDSDVPPEDKEFVRLFSAGWARAGCKD